MEAKKTGRKVVMFPWLAFGHISPFIELAKKLSQHNFQIYFCSSPINLQSIQSKLPQNSCNPIKLVELNLPSLPELPPHMHTTNGLPLHLIPTLSKALDMAAADFSSILQKLDPDLVIIDILQPMAIQMASSLNIPLVTFLVISTGSLCQVLHYILNPNMEFPFPEVDLRDHWVSMAYKNAPKDSSIMVGPSRVLQWMHNRGLCSNLILVNSFKEIEGRYMDYFSNLLKKKVVPVGPLIQETVVSRADEKSNVLEWLDKKQPKSTVYVSFGSEYYLSKEDREELAYGLEMSGANFIWVVRFPKGDHKMRIEEGLPNGFIERAGEKGIVIDEWVPQLQILKHSNIGGFVCHCGWNSVVEAVVHGVSIIALPMQMDQPYHARVAVAAGVGVEVERGVDGAIERRGVAKAIQQVLFQKTGENLNRKVNEIHEIFKVKEAQNIQGCVAELHQLCESRLICSNRNN